jgi:Mif2/CENP-C like
MIFFVTAGKVTVTVNGTVFIISRGGVWQVPRGTCVLAVSTPVSHFLSKFVSLPSCRTSSHDDPLFFCRPPFRFVPHSTREQRRDRSRSTWTGMSVRECPGKTRVDVVKILARSPPSGGEVPCLRRTTLSLAPNHPRCALGHVTPISCNAGSWKYHFCPGVSRPSHPARLRYALPALGIECRIERGCSPRLSLGGGQDVAVLSLLLHGIARWLLLFFCSV